jgi:cytochrome c553
VPDPTFGDVPHGAHVLPIGLHLVVGGLAFGQDRDIWSMVTYIRALKTGIPSPALVVPTPSAQQIAMADPEGDAIHRGAALYYSQACVQCHGPNGDAPGTLRLRPGERQLADAVRKGRPGMPSYAVDDAQMGDLAAFIDTFPR